MESVAITGYFATGSGAVYNLLQEYDSISDGGLSDFEHIFLYDINGVFDTIDKILCSNSLYNSNAAINAFRKRMYQLNKIDFGWFGGYKYRCSSDFIEIIEEFISDITEYKIQRDWYGTFETRKYTLERIIKDTVAIFLKKRKMNHNYGTKIIMNKDNRGEFSFASEETLQRACRKLVNNYLHMMYPSDNKKIILNHMLSPQDAHRLDTYMPAGMKLIIVDRDIRDLYIYNKYTNIWGGSTFPIEKQEFISFMKSYRKTEKPCASDCILRIQFENLIYEYEETVMKIENFVGVNPEEHVKKGQIFMPAKSEKNTQIFNLKEEWVKEVEDLEKEFPELIYSFPHKIETSINELFDA